MACGVPVLTTDTGGIPGILNKNSGICLQTEKSWTNLVFQIYMML